ncbi:MAG: rRNA pseudouridine synthase, partial [Bacteroidaceae bacterium]|nr:rRNA pseudouridine synthase [Bacteroidaceae bacterium]
MDFDNNFNETENNNSNYHPRRQHFIPRSSYQRSDRPYRPQHPRYSKPYDSRPSNDGDGERTFNSYDRKDGFKPRAYQRNGYQRDGFQRDGYQRDGYQRSGYQRNGFKSRPQRPYRKRTDDYDPSAKYNTQKVLRYKEENIDPNEPIRLNRFLANAGVCSRREADTHITAGEVKVNGIVITELGHKVLRTDEVLFKDKPVSMEDKIYILMNKPKGYVTTADDPEGRKIVMDLVKNACPERIYPVVRLDRNTTGVLLLTSDGEMAAKMMHPQYLKKKIYHVF